MVPRIRSRDSCRKDASAMGQGDEHRRMPLLADFLDGIETDMATASATEP
jgi:hypothetical protein